MDENGGVILYTRQIGLRRIGWTMGVRFAQAFFLSPDRENLPDCDVVFCLQVPEPPEGHYAWPFCTLVLDLEQPDVTIFGGIKPEVRRQIRQLDRDGSYTADITADPSPALIDTFCSFYSDFARLKQIDDLHSEEMRAIARERRLVLTCARDHEDRPIVWHAYYRGANRAVQLCSASQFRNTSDPSARAMVGKANRWLHWRALLRFRAMGISLFDFGGWYGGTSDQDLLRINAFKEEFGGRLLHEWNSRQGRSMKGRALVAVKRWREHLQED